MSEQALSAKGIMEMAPSLFQPEKAKGVNAVVQYILTGEGGGEWNMTIADGTCHVTEGRAANPKVTATMDAKDYVDLVTGKLDPMKAFMMGKVKLTGDIGLATRILSFFRQP